MTSRYAVDEELYQTIIIDTRNDMDDLHFNM